MNTLKNIWVILLASITLNSYAQNESDAFQFSQESINGSARFNALGGAFTALGGDISGVYYNPAGAGVYTKSEWSISMGLHTNLTQSNFLGTQTLDGKTNINIPTFAFVAVQKNLPGKWKNGSFSAFLNRANTFHYNMNYSTEESNTSLLDSYLNTLEANDTPWQDLASDDPAYPYDIFLAWNNYLIDINQNEEFYSATGLEPIYQSYQEEVSGAKRETVLSYGANYDDKLYVGAGIVFSRIVYDKNTTFIEASASGDTTTFLRDYVYKFKESTGGLGVGLNLGIIYRPTDNFRIGASFKTPTRYNLDIEFESSNVATFTDTIATTLSPTIGEYGYTMNAPMRANLGLAYVFGKFGLISLDAEVVDYSGTKFRKGADGYQFRDENTSLKENLNTSFNIRAGAEYRVTNNWTLRGGYAQYLNPYTANVDDDASFQIISAGGGFRNSNYFVDASYQYKMSSKVDYAYDINLANRAFIDFQDHIITVTAGVRF
jgi:opacity protein-like surface antigen